MLKMTEFLVRKHCLLSVATQDTEKYAAEEAQSAADESGGPTGVYQLIKKFEPKPKTFSHDIDALIDGREADYKIYGGTGYAIDCGILRQLKKMGVTHLDLPGKIKI